MNRNPLKTRPESVRGRKPLTVHLHPIARAYLDAAHDYTGLPIYLLIEKAVLNAIPPPHELFIDEEAPGEEELALTAFLADLYDDGATAPNEEHALRSWGEDEIKSLTAKRGPKAQETK